VVAPVVLATAPIGAANADVPAAASAGKASAARRAASAAAKTKPGASAVPAEPVRAPPAVAARREEPRSTAGAGATVPNPVDACRDKIFLSREFCLAEHCPKPGLRGHPLCAQWREEVKLREESRTRN
jgi:hypothetical protein